ncbi:MULTISPECIES: homocysteine S-methyltransferase family protein [Anaerolinea]|uniref:homocysteine S-methyltransferase family protein n=1 Tax=Anaerolinea TaxID=233189 RepID=UPI00262883E5|nr:homocysteine S-methyltransferase family protein [Anaerolinea thermophila]
MKHSFSEVWQKHVPVILDGATATNLQRRGLPLGVPSDLWTLERPDEVLRLHREFLMAGAQIILTNTFGSSRFRLRQAGVEDRFEATLQKAVALARQATRGGDFVWVAASLGPLGEWLEPVGSLSPEQARVFYREQALALVQAGVDMLVIETQMDLREALVAVDACRSVGEIPVVCSFSFDAHGCLLSGERPAQVARALESSGVLALGVNCGYGLEGNLQVLEEMRAVTALPLWFKPNAGLPVLDEKGQIVYPVTPEQMGACARRAVQIGAQFVGGCCGTTPDHLRAIAQALRKAR